MSDLYKRQTSKKSDGCIYKEKRQTLVQFEQKLILIRKKNHSVTVIKSKIRK